MAVHKIIIIGIDVIKMAVKVQERKNANDPSIDFLPNLVFPYFLPINAPIESPKLKNSSPMKAADSENNKIVKVTPINVKLAPVNVYFSFGRVICPKNFLYKLCTQVNLILV